MFPEKPTPFVITGHPRSGTTSLRYMGGTLEVQHHPEVQLVSFQLRKFGRHLPYRTGILTLNRGKRR